MTIPHFRRILNFSGITLGNREFQLLTKRFMKHNFTINYAAFLSEFRESMDWFDRQGIKDTGRDFQEFFPGRFITVDSKKASRPEIGKIDVAKTFGTSKACHPCLQQAKPRDMKLGELILRIKKHILDNGIRTREFFEKFDVFRRGFISKSHFLRGLEAIGLSGLHRLCVTEEDFEKLLKAYGQEYDPERIQWSKFCDHIDEVFTIK